MDIGGLLTEDQEYTEMMLMSKAGLLEGEYRRARGLCGIEGAG